MDAYFPGRFVNQTDLEAHDGVGAGKYTIGELKLWRTILAEGVFPRTNSRHLPFRGSMGLAGAVVAAIRRA
jgi:hypothetical protein